MKARQDAILLLSNNTQLKDLLRHKLHSLKKDIAILNKNSRDQLGNFNIKLTIIDDYQDLNLLGPIITSNTAVVLRDKTLLNFQRILEYNINYILELPINENLLCAIIHKSLGMLRDNCPQFILFHNLKLCLSQNYVVYKESKINLTRIESTIMYNLMTKQGINPQEEKINDRYLQVTIFRINKKFKECINIKIIRSKYGVGYYIAI
ncbi:MAG: hypothetical protein AB9915_03355 [Candidatus Dojkabacteria bacterium]